MPLKIFFGGQMDMLPTKYIKVNYCQAPGPGLDLPGP